MVTAPVTIGPDATPRRRRRRLRRYRISGLPVVDAAGVLLGIVTNRDLRFETDRSRRVADVMTPMPLVTAPGGHLPGRRDASCCAGTRWRSCRWSTTPAG